MGHIIKPSRRGIANLESGAFIDLEDEITRQLPRYDPDTCPNGLIDLSGATNALMGDFMAEQAAEFAKSYALEDAFKYGEVVGPKELSESVARFMNRLFAPASPVLPQHILPASGVSALIDLVAFNLCDRGEGVMLLTPTYMMFPHDLCARAGLELVTVSTAEVRDQFSADYAHHVVEAIENAHRSAQSGGIRVKALLLCNPCNPMGRCYSSASLGAIAKFCGQHHMHLLSDEIYAMSTFEAPGPAFDRFTSVLSLEDDHERGIFKENIHCMYGASKDFACGGLRLGFLVTRNELLWKTCRRLCLFTWLNTFSASFFADFISKANVVDRYLGLYRRRLGDSYFAAAKLLEKHGIPFEPANSGLFIFVKLTKWLVHFDGSDPVDSREMQLCRHLAKAGGVFLSLGQLCLSPVPGCFRLVHAAGDTKMVELAILRIAKTVSHLETLPRFAGGDELFLARVTSSGTDADTLGKEHHGDDVERRIHERSLRYSMLRLFSCSLKEP